MEQRGLDGLTDAADVREGIGWALSHAFTDESASRLRDPWDLSPSKLAGCTRRGAYAIAHTPPSDVPAPAEGCAANLGTYIHQGLLPRMADRVEGATVERQVLLQLAGLKIHADGMRGSVDLDTRDCVVDLKTVSQYRMALIRRVGVLLEHLIQVWAYALARHQEGDTPRWVAVIYLDRTSGDREIFVEPFTVRSALQVINRAVELREHAQDPDNAPRVDITGASILGAGFGYHCDECPFLRRCWGEDATPGRYTPRTHDNLEVERLLVEYLDARAVEAAAARRKEEIATLLGSVRTGVYGAVRYSRGQDVETIDKAATVKLLEELGFDVPMTLRRGSLNIRPVAAMKGDGNVDAVTVENPAG